MNHKFVSHYMYFTCYVDQNGCGSRNTGEVILNTWKQLKNKNQKKNPTNKQQ